MKGTPWTPRERKRLAELWPTHTATALVKTLGRSAVQIKSAAKRYGLRTAGRAPWTGREIARLRELYPTTPAPALERAFGRKIGKIHAAARRYGIAKNPEFVRAHCRIQKGAHIGAEHCYPKGHVPANKGLRRPGYAPGRMAETQFKKGQRSQTWHAVGSIIPDGHGFLRIKIRERRPGDAPGWNPQIWPALHHQVWIEHHGPIPPHHAVVFKDGDRRNCTIGNLECIQRAELARRNAMWNRFPPELTEAIMLNAALKRKLRRLYGTEQNVGSTGPSVRNPGTVEGPRETLGPGARENDQRSSPDHHQLGQGRSGLRQSHRGQLGQRVLRDSQEPAARAGGRSRPSRDAQKLVMLLRGLLSYRGFVCQRIDELTRRLGRLR